MCCVCVWPINTGLAQCTSESGRYQLRHCQRRNLHTGSPTPPIHTHIHSQTRKQFYHEEH